MAKARSFVGNIISKSDDGKVKLRTLSTLGAQHEIWIDPKDIISKTEYDKDVVKIDVKLGSEIMTEKAKKVRVEDSSISKVMKAAGGGLRPRPFEDDDECSNCDWKYSTDCSSCTDQNSSQRCARPFFPY